MSNKYPHIKSYPHSATCALHIERFGASCFCHNQLITELQEQIREADVRHTNQSRLIQSQRDLINRMIDRHKTERSSEYPTLQGQDDRAECCYCETYPCSCAT